MKEEFQKCPKCKENEAVFEVFIDPVFYEIGSYCPNEKCDRFELLRR